MLNKVLCIVKLLNFILLPVKVWSDICIIAPNFFFMGAVLLLCLGAYIYTCYVVSSFAPDRNISNVGILFTSIFLTPIFGAFIILATKTTLQKELESTMLDYFKNNPHANNPNQIENP